MLFEETDGMIRILRSANPPTYDGIIRMLKRNHKIWKIQKRDQNKKVIIPKDFNKYEETRTKDLLVPMVDPLFYYFLRENLQRHF